MPTPEPKSAPGEAWHQLAGAYDEIAGSYEARFLDELADKPGDRELLASFAEAATDPVVEIGCGPGQIGAFVRGHGRRVFGLDLSRQMATRARARLDGVAVADMRALPIASGRLGGILAFYSLIHLRRVELGIVLTEFHRVLAPGGRVLFSAHEGRGEIARDEFLGAKVPFVASLFELDELVEASEDAGLAATRAERREGYASESGTVRLHIEATKPTFEF